MDKQEVLRVRVYEAILRAVSGQNWPFMLKGSWLLAKYYPDPWARLKVTEDLDFVFLERLADPMGSEHNFREVFAPYFQAISAEVGALPWAQAAEVVFDLDADGAFQGESFLVDYALEDDFVTSGTTLAYCTVGERQCLEFNVGMTMNLPLFFTPQSLTYVPLSGDEPFIVPYAARDEVQAGWKLHQCLVRVRPKDLVDLGYLLAGLDFTNERVLRRMLATVVGECLWEGWQSPGERALQERFKKIWRQPEENSKGKLLLERLKWLLNGDTSDIQRQYQQMNRWEQSSCRQNARQMAGLLPINEPDLFDCAAFFSEAVQTYLDGERCGQIIDQLSPQPIMWRRNK